MNAQFKLTLEIKQEWKILRSQKKQECYIGIDTVFYTYVTC